MALLCTAIGTIVLAIVTAVHVILIRRIIKQNSDIRQKERKERLLREIIDWGESIRRCSFLSNLEELIVVSKLPRDDKQRVLALKHDSECRIIAVRYTYLKNAALELDASVQSAIKIVSDNLARHIKLLGLEFDGKTEESDVPNSINTLQKSVNKMIEVAAGLLPK